MELIFTDEDQVVPKPGTLLQRGTGKGKSAGLAVIDRSVQSHSLRELSWLGMAMYPPSAWVSVLRKLGLGQIFPTGITKECKARWDRPISNLPAGQRPGRWQPGLRCQ